MPSTLTWEAQIARAADNIDTALAFVQNGIKIVQNDDMVLKLVKALPVLEPFAEKLFGAVPVLGQARLALDVAKWGLDKWQAIAAFGAAAQFAPADWKFFDALEESRGSQE